MRLEATYDVESMLAILACVYEGIDEEKTRMEDVSRLMDPRGVEEYEVLYNEVMDLITKLDQYIGKNGRAGSGDRW